MSQQARSQGRGQELTSGGSLAVALGLELRLGLGSALGVALRLRSSASFRRWCGRRGRGSW
jgi:hypothetical protein